jgi:hypothetical protein
LLPTSAGPKTIGLAKKAIIVAVIASCSLALIAPAIGSLVGLVLIVLPILAMMGKIKNSAVRLLTPAKTPGPRIGEMCFGIALLVASMGVSSWNQQRERAAVAKAQQEEAEEARRHHDAEISKLQQDLGPALVRCQAWLDSAKTQISAANYANAMGHVQQASTCVYPFLILSPRPPALASFRTAIEGLSAQITPITEAKTAWNEAHRLIETSEESRREREFMTAESSLGSARRQLTSIEDTAAKALNYDVSQALGVVDAKLKLVKRPAERQEAALKKEQDALKRRGAEEAIQGEDAQKVERPVDQWIIKDGFWVGAPTKQQFDKFMEIADQGDEQALREYVFTTPGLAVLKPNTVVFIVEMGLLSSLVKVRPKGQVNELYISHDALKK